MKICPKCHAQLPDNVQFCAACGTPLDGNPNPQYPPQGTYYNPTDHTAEFSPADISANKVIAMLPYLLGSIGLIIAILAIGESKYIAFHVKQALKLTVCSTLITIASLLLCWTFIVPIVGGIAGIIIWVLKIIAFFQVCSGKAKEPAIISSLGFLK